MHVFVTLALIVDPARFLMSTDCLTPFKPCLVTGTQFTQSPSVAGHAARWVFAVPRDFALRAIPGPARVASAGPVNSTGWGSAMRQLGPGHYAQLASGPEPGPRCDTGRRHRTAGRHVHGLRGQADHHRHARSGRLELERVVRKARRSGERSTPRRYKAMWPREAERGSKRVLSITGSRGTENLARAIARGPAQPVQPASFLA